MYFQNNQVPIRPTQIQRSNANVVQQNSSNLSTGTSPMVLVTRSPIMPTNRTQSENNPFSPQLNAQVQMYHMNGPGSVGTASQQQSQIPQNQSPMMMSSMQQHGASTQQQQSPVVTLMQPVQHPMSNNPLTNNSSTMIAPNTSQQQQIYQQHLQPGSISQCSPYSAQIHSTYSSHNNNAPLSSVQSEQQQLTTSAGGPSSVPAPNSVPSVVGNVMQHQAVTASQQTPTLPNIGFQAHETDPIASAKLLILRDLRKTLMDVNLAAERVSQRVLGAGSGNTSVGICVGDDKRNAAPQSNSQNPFSVMNPQSLLNPMSVNAPNSVKSISDEKIQSDSIADSGNSGVNGNPLDIYNNAVNNFLNTCDDIEKNLQVIVEVNRRMQRFEGTCSLRTPSDMANLGFPQLQQHYIDLMYNDKRSLARGIERISQLQSNFRTATTAKRSAAMIIPEDAIGENKKSRDGGTLVSSSDCKQDYKI